MTTTPKPPSPQSDSDVTVYLDTAAERARRAADASAQETVVADLAGPVINPRLQQTLTPGMVLKNRFVLETIIGSGGMSIVFKARDLRKEEARDINPFVAMKVLGTDFKRHPDAFVVLQRETRKSQSLAHPNIVTVYDFDRDGNTVFMTMECLEGGTLDKLIAQHPTGMPLAQALPIINGMVQALAYAHKKNIIHSDFKPGNVFCTEDSTVKVLDFGIARAMRATDDSKAGHDDFDPVSLGALTMAYASYEMFKGAEADPRDDIYALACITYELLSGRHPFNKTPADRAYADTLEPGRLPGLNRRQWTALKRALAFKREDRTPDVMAFLEGIDPQRGNHGGRYMAGVLMAMALAGGGFLYYGNHLSNGAAPVIALTPEQQEKISGYLDIAEFYMQLEQWATPPGDSAFDMYQKVLTIDPNHQQAREGIARIADAYLAMAQKARQDGDLDASRTYVDTGLQLMPGHQGLQTMAQQLR